jgi:glycosyltransferase involved in cell wall biosynthesis
MTSRVPVSVLVPIKNEAENLSRCLGSVAWADEIVVVDSHSTDESPAVAERHGARIVQFDFNGTWPKKKNWALENVPFKHGWVLILDADEVLPAEAGAEIASAIAQSGSVAGYWINRRFFFLGRWLRHSYYPNWNLRLFRHSLGRYERLTEADTRSGDNEVHEHVIVQGPTARLRFEMDHYAFPSIEVFIEKHNRYSNWEARVAVDKMLPASSGALSHKRVERRRRLKLLSQRLPFRPLLRFLYVYIWQKGFLDGWDGYYFARLHATYEFLSVAKTYELRRRAQRSAD